MSETSIPSGQLAGWHGSDRRASPDRRTFTLHSIYHCLVNPRRTRGRRREDRRYPLLDVFDSGAAACVLLLIVFSITDAVFTLTLLARGGTELNPIMNYFLGLGTSSFMIVKMLLTAVPALILTAAGNLKVFNRVRARSLLAALVGLYAGLIFYEIGLLWMSA